MIFSNYRRAIITGGALAFLFAATPVISTYSATPVKKTLDRACMQKTTAVRDGAIMAALDTSVSSLKIGMQKRSDAIVAGWGIEKQAERRTALKSAWDEWKKTVKSARGTLATARVQAWKQFQTDRAACGPGAESDDRSAQGAIDSVL